MYTTYTCISIAPTEPRDLQFSDTNYTRVTLTWNPPERPNGIITNYTVCIYVCIYVSMYKCINVCIYVHMYVCIYL